MFSAISKIICISLRGRDKRRAQAEAEFESAGIASRIDWLIVDPHPEPKAGFSQSQVKALEMCQGHEHALIFEDDFIFTGDISLSTIMRELPPEYLACWLGGNVRTQNRNRCTPHLWLCGNTWATHAMLYSKAGVKAILERYEAPETISDPGQIYDEWLRTQLQPGGGCFICKPFFAVQSEGWSDLEKRPTFYGPLWKKAELRLC